MSRDGLSTLTLSLVRRKISWPLLALTHSLVCSTLCRWLVVNKAVWESAQIPLRLRLHTRSRSPTHTTYQALTYRRTRILILLAGYISTGQYQTIAPVPLSAQGLHCCRAYTFFLIRVLGGLLTQFKAIVPCGGTAVPVHRPSGSRQVCRFLHPRSCFQLTSR